MRVTFGKNIISLKAQSELSKSIDSVSKASERLASGQRINRASDDAAGLAISSSLNASTRVYGQAIRNINDGISRLNIAEGALAELTDVVSRIQELAEQSANGTFSAIQRRALNREGQALREEFNRIVSSTSFNGVPLLNASTTGVDIQVGTTADENSRIRISVGAALQRSIGDGTFQFNQNIAHTGRQVGTGLTDFDGDGDLDILGIADTGGSFSLSRGNGDGTFSAPVSLSSAASSSLIIGDFTGDGRPDVIRSRFDGLRLETNVGGNSVSGTSISTFEGTLGTGDFNNDGRTDVFARNSSGESIYLFMSNGDGTFQSALTISTAPATTISTVADDFNGDGNLDIISAGSFYFNIHLGNGDGSFSPVTTVTSPVGTANTISSGDFNRDGYVDVVYGNAAGSGRIMLGNGNGTFASPVVFDLGAVLYSMTAQDLNDDGMEDIAAGLANGAVAIFMGNGDGTFVARKSYAGATATIIQGLSFGDVNGDGALDIVSGTYTGNSVGVWLANDTPSSQLYSFSLLTQSSSREALVLMQDVMEELSITQSTIGAAQSRLLTALRSAQSTRENVISANSRIIDADVAEESAELVRATIRQQVSTAVLGQANQQPQLLLKLLQS